MNPQDPRPAAAPTNRDHQTGPGATAEPSSAQEQQAAQAKTQDKARPTEHGGPRGPEPTRYGDWEKNGRCIDF